MTNGRIAPVKLILISVPSNAFNASMTNLALKEIFNSSPSIDSATISSTTLPISGVLEETSIIPPSMRS